MNNAIALIEYSKIPTGMVAADKMMKGANIDLINAYTVCPGKYIVLFKGSLAAVKAALEIGTVEFNSTIIDSFILGNPKEQIYEAINGATSIHIEDAIGIVESYSVASIIEGADLAIKTADVELLEIRLARGMCGKSFYIITGELAAVNMAVEVSSNILKEKCMLLDYAVIANPDENFVKNLY